MPVPLSIVKGAWKYKGAAADTVWNHKGMAINAGLGSWAAMSTFDDARHEGSGIVSSALQAVAEGFIGSTIPGALALTAKDLIPAGYEFIQSERAMLRQESAHSQVPFSNAYFQDQPQFATMRQAGMALAKKSEYNLQQAQLGNEARYMHKE